MIEETAVLEFGLTCRTRQATEDAGAGDADKNMAVIRLVTVEKGLIEDFRIW
jgi:hypothetical protein